MESHTPSSWDPKTNDDPFEGLDESEREILMREMREGRHPMPEIAKVDPLICAKCKHSLVRGVSTSGKGRYTCPNPKCEDSFKVWHVRESGSIRPVTKAKALDMGEEKRDLRDPTELGELLTAHDSHVVHLALTHYPNKPTLSQVYDFGAKRGLF